MQSNKSFRGMRVYIRAKDTDGSVFEEYKKDGLDGQLDREDGPAYIHTLPNGVVLEECYFKNGRPHREDGPAEIRRRIHGGGILHEKYFVDGKLHREDGPAELLRDERGRAYSEAYWQNGKPQLDGLENNKRSR
jgi:uncharacterized protein